jgi:hypothetical protein
MRYHRITSWRSRVYRNTAEKRLGRWNYRNRVHVIWFGPAVIVRTPR